MPENVFIWDDLPRTTQELFLGVARGWWEDVDIKRGAPIPFAKIFNLADRPEGTNHFKTIAQVAAHFKVFESVKKAREAGWDKPLVPGEFWMLKRTARVLVIHASP